MISLSKNIKIKAQQSIVWAFISDLPTLITINRFRSKVHIPSDYNLNQDFSFKIINNFGLGNIEMNAEVVKSNAPAILVIREWAEDSNKISYQHETEYCIDSIGQASTLTINQKGTFGTKVQDISFKPIISGIIQDELYRIKKFIESSQTAPSNGHKKGFSPI